MTLKEMERNELVSIHIVLTCGEKVPSIIFQSVALSNIHDEVFMIGWDVAMVIT